MKLIALLLLVLPVKFQSLGDEFSSQVSYKGGVLFMRFQGKLCPAPQVLRQSPTHFQIIQQLRPGQICLEPSRQAEYILVLGQVEGNTPVTITYQNELEPVTLHYTTPAPERTISDVAKANGKFTFKVNAHPEAIYTVLRTFDLKTWTSMGVLSAERVFNDTAEHEQEAYYQIKIESPPPRPLPPQGL